ncbi:MAG: baseplate J/gp47 family protein [Planctomycetota bacterium]|jgi:uncharacterized phage protein gp47/JayE
MALSRPTLRQLIERAEQDINSRLPGADSRLRRSILGVIARAHAAATHGLYGFLVFLAEQFFADTAVGDYLRRLVSIYALSIPEAQKAAGPVVFTGDDGYTVQVGWLLARGDEVEYVTTSSAVISGGSATVNVEAVLAGADGNADAGTILSLVSPQTGIDSSPVTVDTGGLVGGTDVETDEERRVRLLRRIRKPPQGGNVDDYVTWALEVAGITRAWCFPLSNGPGTVTVCVVRDDDIDGPIPDAAEVQEVQDHIDDDYHRPVTADALVYGPTAVDVDFTITVLPDTAEVRANVEAELRDVIRRDGEPGGVLRVSRLNEAISLAAGEESHVMSVPAADLTFTSTELPVFGTITWL